MRLMQDSLQQPSGLSEDTSGHLQRHTCHSASMGSELRGALVEPGSLGFMPNTFRLQPWSWSASSDDSPGHTLA